MRVQSFTSALLIIAVSIISLNSCNRSAKKVKKKRDTVHKAWNKTIPGSFSEQTILVFDSGKVATFLTQYPELDAYKSDIRNFYTKRKYAYAWFEKNALIEQAGNLANRVMNIQQEGIYKAPPYQKKLDSLLYTVNSAKKQKPNPELELMLTAQYFVFAKMAWNGLSSAESKASSWYVPRKKISYDQYLDSLLSAKGRSADEPVYRQYDLLRGFLKKYTQLDTLEKWAPIVAAKTLKPGDSSAVIAKIKRRLFQLSDFKGDTTGALYDTTLQASVKQFQERHGLYISGQVNKATLTELNVTPKDRIRQILVNMERSRWLPVSVDKDYLAVNIPEFKLHVYHADSLLWSCNVVVGQTVHQTTVFYGEVKYIVFSPYWNVPPGILKNEILPGMRRNPNYLAAHNMELTGYEGKTPVIRQKPGASNSLGLVKFLFPNSYNIYLHDTPSKSLFGESSRAFSHGCIRVGEPARLAAFLLRDKPEWTPEKIDKAMHAGKEQYYTLKQKVPVFIAYFTAFVNRDGRLNFRKDIYKLDERLAATIMSGKGSY
ncbi:L,D-transpeptidase family protein [Mucilaginibacter gynuensis]|uniref:L,D-transpeptidase family protein n=1 Tax=Mucilaginibacter gynuensis TaxID=1302236 RepID=A0ABP8GDA7_9SPHI